MAALTGILRQVWGLFVDDGSLALALVVWVAGSGLGLRHLPVPSPWDGPVLFAGCLAVLAITVMRSARGRGR